jgi:hypothetical protein
MTDTTSLIRQLAARAQPVRPLASPLRRTAAWLAFAAAVIAAVVAVQGLQPTLVHSLTTGRSAFEFAASVATGIAAAYAAFQVSVPGRSPRWIWLPLPFLFTWLGGLGAGCMADAARLGSAAFAMRGEVRECALAISLVSLPMLAGMLLMVRHAGVVRPGSSAWLAMLAAAALSSAGVSLIHQGESAWMALVWHAGAVLLLSLACLALGRPLFSWIGYARPDANER